MRISLAAPVVMLMLLTFASSSAQSPERKPSPTKSEYLQLAAEIDSSLEHDVISVWFPRTVDYGSGGFSSNFARDWQPTASEGKFSVFQGRMTWVAAQLVMQRPERKAQFLPYVRHGVDFLDSVLWDAKYGGFYWGVGDDGKVNAHYGESKNMYGMSFCLYALAAAYAATKDPAVLESAKRAFHWMDEHAYDEKNGGYFESLTRQGQPIPADPGGVKAQEAALAGFPVGYKSMNTHIHLLESFAQLYQVWNDDLVRRRLEELLEIVRDRICVQPGVMNLYFTSDWRPLPYLDSYGHDIETAFLMNEAENALGIPHDPRTERMGKMLVDHALTYGWDEKQGGFFREGPAFGPAQSREKEWWVQVEGLNALLLMHEKYSASTSVYFQAFRKQWQFIRDHQIDSQHHGLFEMLDAAGTPIQAGKGRIWKAAYHDGRAFLNSVEHLRELARHAPEP